MSTDPKTLLATYGPKQVKALPQSRQLCIVRFSPDGKVLAAGDFEGTVQRWDSSTDSFAPLPPLSGHGGWVQSLAFHPDGKRLFSADSWGRLCAWPFTEKEPRPLWSVEKAHDGWVRGVAVSPDGKVLASCGRDGVVRLWEEKGAKKLELAGGLDTFAVAFHPDGKSLMSGDLKGLIKVWDLPTGKVARELDAREMYLYDRIQDIGGVRHLSFDAAGTTLAAAGGEPTTGGFVEGTPLVIYFDATTGKRKQAVKVGVGNDGYAYEAHWHPAGFVMGVTSGQPGQGKLFFHRPGDALPFFLVARPNCHSLAVHPSLRRLVVQGTNANSAGNGRVLGKDKAYPGNSSPLLVWDLPKA